MGKTPPRERSVKILAVTEVLIVRFLVYSLVANGLLFLAFGTTQPDSIAAPYLVGALWFVIPGSVILITRRPFKPYGITKGDPRLGTHLGFNAFVFRLTINATVVVIFLLGWSYLDPLGALLMTAAELVALALILQFLQHPEFQPDTPAKIEIPEKKHKSNLITIGILLAFPILLGLTLSRFSLLLLSTVVWQFVFSGFGEEFFFRGYTQGRLNQAFGRPYSWKSIQFGPGLFITAPIFAITHILNPFNPWAGQWEFAWWWGTFTFVGGITFGLLREKTGCLIAPGIAHGMEAVGEGLGILFF